MDLSSMLHMDLPVPHEDGSFISERVSRVAELVRQYDHHVDVRWIRPDQREPNEPAFAIVYRNDDASEYVIFYVQDEDHFDGTVLQRLHSMDASKKDGNILSEIDAKNEAARIIQQAVLEEARAEQIDLAYHVLKSPKHNYKHDGTDYGK